MMGSCKTMDKEEVVKDDGGVLLDDDNDRW